MFQRLHSARLLGPALVSAVAFTLLVGLGFWQLQRLAWKEGLIQAIETRTRLEPVSLAEALERWQSGEDVEYLRVKAEGRFLHDNEFYLYAPSASEGPGYHVYTPMVVFVAVPEAGDGKPRLSVANLIVNRGFVPEALKSPEKRAAGRINDQPIEIPVETYHQGSIKGASVVGLLRNPEMRGLFTPENDTKSNTWYWRDLESMSKALNPAHCQKGDPSKTFCGQPGYPFFLDLEASDVPGGWPKGGVTIVKLPNRHLEYALTWFGLAATLAAVFAAFAMQRLEAVSGPGG
jgi:surfeit locus 1 family protein